MYQTFRKASEQLAMVLALAGGLILLVLIALTCYSIIGRELLDYDIDIGLKPIRGIYDMTELGMAAAIFAFLPWAQLRDTHARVDLFQGMMPDLVGKLLEVIFALIMLVVATVGSYRLYLGMMDKYRFTETTLIAQIPVWQGYALGLVGAIGFVLISAFCTLRALRRTIGLPD